MVYRIMDVNRDGALVTVIDSNNGKNALKRFLRVNCFSTGFYEIRRGKYNWCLLGSNGAAFYALPEREGKQ